jgi:hypothetical protein
VAANIKGMPSNEFYVSRVKPSRFDAGTCYVTFDGHESGNFRPWVFKTADYGATWTDITGNLPEREPVYAIEQDTKNPGLLFAGTEFAIYYSISDGHTWTKFNRNLPTVAVHDIVVHPRDPDIIIGTHGRGIWIMDDISALQQMTPDLASAEAHLFRNETGTHWLRIEPMDNGGPYAYVAENPPKGVIINYYLGESAAGEVTVEVTGAGADQTRRFAFNATPGVGKLEWDMYFPTTGGGGGATGRRGGRGGGSDEPAPTAAAAAGERGRGERGAGQRGAGLAAEAPAGAETQTAEGQRGERGRGVGRRGRGQGEQAAGGGGRRGGRGRGGRGGPTGTPAPPGAYRVTMTVNGTPYYGSVMVRQDPMLEGKE